MRTVLITGAAGFIGSHLADKLLAQGDRVFAFDNFNDYYDARIKRQNVAQALRSPNYELCEADVCDQDQLVRVVKRVRPDVVIHLAAQVGVRASLENPNLYYRVNVLGTQNVLDCCRETGLSHLVCASSSSVYGDSKDIPFVEDNPALNPISPYAASKRMTELMAYVYHKVHGLEITMLRFFTVYGPRQRPDMAIHKFTRLIYEGQPVPMFGDGSSERDYTYVDDVVDGVVKAVERPFPFETINLGGHHTTCLRDLIDTISTHVGKPAVIDRKPPQPGDVPRTYADITKAHTLLEFTPKVSLNEGIRRFVEWFKANQRVLRADVSSTG